MLQTYLFAHILLYFNNILSILCLYRRKNATLIVDFKVSSLQMLI